MTANRLGDIVYQFLFSPAYFPKLHKGAVANTDNNTNSRERSFRSLQKRQDPRSCEGSTRRSVDHRTRQFRDLFHLHISFFTYNRIEFSVDSFLKRVKEHYWISERSKRNNKQSREATASAEASLARTKRAIPATRNKATQKSNSRRSPWPFL